MRHYELDGEVLNAVEVTLQTLVAYSGNFPRSSGNCFSLLTDDGRHFKIVNFNVENLQELIKRGVISYPVKILAIGERIAVVHDHRIPDEWYATEFCKVCTPFDLLPLPQKLEHCRNIDSGRIKIVDLGDGSFIEKSGVSSLYSCVLDPAWKVESKMDSALFYSPYMPRGQYNALRFEAD